MSTDVILSAPSIPPLPPIPDTASLQRLAALHDSQDSQDYLGAIIAVSALLICVALPLCLWYLSRARATRNLSMAEYANVQDLWSTAQRMETRIGYLERVLDTEVPGWRIRSEMR